MEGVNIEPDKRVQSPSGADQPVPLDGLEIQADNPFLPCFGGLCQLSQQGSRLLDFALQSFRTREYSRGPRSAPTASRSSVEGQSTRFLLCPCAESAGVGCNYESLCICPIVVLLSLKKKEPARKVLG